MHAGKVVLLDHTYNPIRTVANAFRTCRMETPPWEQEFTREDDIELIKRCLPAGHKVPLEQCVFTFGLSGQSRAFSAQFLRSRLTSPVQQSQRAVTPSLDNAVIPAEYWRILFEGAYSIASAVYDDLLSRGVPKEDARYVLPMGTASNIQITMNLAEFIHICNERLCNKTQEEYKLTVLQMCQSLFVLGEDFNSLFRPYFEPKCGISANGFCKEAAPCLHLRKSVPTRKEFLAWRARRSPREALEDTE